MKRILLIIGGILIVNTVISAIGFGAFMWRFSAKIPAAEYDAPRDQAEARQQDLDYLLNLTKSDYSFSDAEKVAFEKHVAEMSVNAASMTDAEFAVGVAAAAAITENGHTNMSIARAADDLNSLPVRFFWFADGLFITRARAEYADLIGARIIAYDDAPPETLLSQLDEFQGGTEEIVRFRSPHFFGSPAVMHAAKMANSPDRVSLSLELADGEMRDVILEVEQRPTETMHSIYYPLPIKSKEEIESGHDWRFLDPKKAGATYYAKYPERDLWSDALPGGGAYLRLRITMKRDGNNFTGWLADLKKKYSAEPVDYLVLDLRSNGGGNYLQSRDFATHVSDFVKPNGKIYMLSDDGTFSAALVTMAFALSDAGDQGVVVGGRPGDDEQFWAESGGALRLPNSDLAIWVSTGYHDWENGCKDWSRCFWPNILLGVAAGPLDPDIIAPLTFDDYSQGIDTTMQAVFAAEGIFAE